MTEPNYIMTISVPAEIASKTVSSSILQCIVLSGHVNNGVSTSVFEAIVDGRKNGCMRLKRESP